jgi:hypothetical protein
MKTKQENPATKSQTTRPKFFVEPPSPRAKVTYEITQASAALLEDYAKFLWASRGVPISASTVLERLSEELLKDKLFASSTHRRGAKQAPEVRP